MIELLEAADWYKARSQRVSAEFMQPFETTLARIAQYPFGYQQIFGRIRRAPMRRFPYGIVYRVDETEIVVFSCFHNSRDPSHWQKRV